MNKIVTDLTARITDLFFANEFQSTSTHLEFMVNAAQLQEHLEEDILQLNKEMREMIVNRVMKLETEVINEPSYIGISERLAVVQELCSHLQNYLTEEHKEIYSKLTEFVRHRVETQRTVMLHQIWELQQTGNLAVADGTTPSPRCRSVPLSPFLNCNS